MLKMSKRVLKSGTEVLKSFNIKVSPRTTSSTGSDINATSSPQLTTDVQFNSVMVRSGKNNLLITSSLFDVKIQRVMWLVWLQVLIGNIATLARDVI